MPVGIDLSSCTEDQRIKIMVAVLKDRENHPDVNEAGKPFQLAIMVKTKEDADRYMEKIKAGFPSVRIIENSALEKFHVVTFDRGRH